MRVDYATAVMLKEKGYDVPCGSYRWDGSYKFISDCPPDIERLHHIVGRPENHNSIATRISAPTLAEAADWLRGNGVHVYCEPNIYFTNWWWRISTLDHMNCEDPNCLDPFPTHDEALHGGIKQALLLIGK